MPDKQTQAELDAIQKEKEKPTQEQRLQAMEDAMMEMMLGSGSNV